MKLKYYNLVIIVPVFFILGVILASFNYYILTKEVKNGLAEEAKSISTAMGIFLKQDYIQNDKDKIKLSFERIIRFERVNRLYLIKNDEVIIKTKAQKLEEGEYDYKDSVLLEIIHENNVGSYNILYTVKDTPYKLFISLDATKEEQSMLGVLYQVLSIIVIMLILGVIVSYILSFITKNSIDSLNSIADSIASGDYRSHNKDFTIKEIGDLSNTLDIVKSILKEMLYKTKNSILDTDTNNNDDLIKPTIVLDEPKELKSENFDLAIAINKNINQRELYSCWSDENYIYGFVGELDSTSDYLKDYISVSSAIKYIKHMMANNNFDLERLRAMYDIKSIVTLKIDIKESKLSTQRLFENNISKEKIVLENDELKSFSHNLHIDTKLENYIQMYSHLELDKIADDLNKVFDKESAVIFVKRKIG